jgi:hypothetical protein
MQRKSQNDQIDHHLTQRRGCAVGGSCRAAVRRRLPWAFLPVPDHGLALGGERAAAMYTLIAMAKLNGIDPEAWLADVLRRINDTRHPNSTNFCHGTGAATSSAPPDCGSGGRSYTPIRFKTDAS